MRIISGIYRGRQFKAKAPKGVRPTADAVRESIFNVLNNIVDINDARVCDICAGTGALGIEALSRGAAFCNFIEKSPGTARYIKNVLAEFRAQNSNYKITVLDAVKALKTDDSSYDIIFFDPPYFENLYDNVLNLIAENNILAENGVAVVEHDEKSELQFHEKFEILNQKKSGSTIVTYLELKH